MKGPCGQEDCDCGHTIERLQKQMKEAGTFTKEVREYRDFWLAKYDEDTIKHHDVVGRLKRRRDHYKALAERLRNDAFKDRLTVEKLRELVKEFAAHPCVDCVGGSAEAERRL